MQLRLHYHDAPQRPASAAFLRGADAGAWLREIGRWQVPAAALACYVVPESLQSVRAAGLLVVAKNGPLPALADAWEPYGVEAGRLYLPVRATLWPATDPAELSAALLWPRQVFHPTIGLVGFDGSDEIRLADLLALSPPRAADWSGARPGRPARPPLSQIRVLAPTVADLLAALGLDVGTEPLDSLPPSAGATPGPGRLDGLSRSALQAALAATQALRELLAAGAGALAGAGGSGDGVSGGGGGGVGGPGLFEQLEKWLNQNLDDLEKKRHAELERLLDLFGQDPAAALRFAIPLAGPYFNRGTAPPSARLGPRSTDFNLGQLGGGGRVDAWNLDSFQDRLRAQYQAAARQETAAGHPKKAAYIYAHLLGDFLAAAKALEQGRHFREAAVLYRDHLRNLPAAAECLERGGLLPEAADLYAELKQHERAGDLYQRLGQPAPAAAHFEQATAQALAAGDHPAAARLQLDKLGQPDRARQTLLEGWTNSAQPEACLRRYFDLVADTAPATLGAQLTEVLRYRTPPARRASLLHVLVGLTDPARPPADPAALPAARAAAYELLSAEAAAGNLALLPLLPKFLPADRLVAADLSRFAAARRVRPPRPAAADAWHLDQRIAWRSAVTHRNQFLALGLRDGQLHLARANWYGHVEYYAWPAALLIGEGVGLVADAQHGPRVILRHAEAAGFETKVLPKNKHFDQALTVEAPAWLPPWPAGVALLPDGGLTAATISAGQLTLHRFDAAGELLEILPVKGVEDDKELLHTIEPHSVRQLLYREDCYYSFSGNHLLVIRASGGVCQPLDVGVPVSQLTASAYAADLVLAYGLPNGGLVWDPAQDLPDESPVFEVDAPLTDLQFVSAEHLVVASAHEAAVFALAAEAAPPLHTVSTEAAIIAVLPTADRHRFALLEASGRVSLHAVEAG